MFPIVSKDDIRKDIGIIKSNRKKEIGTDEQEAEVSRIQKQKIETLLNKRKSFAIDNTNLGDSLEDLLKILRQHKVRIIGVHINTPLNVCIQRRPEIPESVLKNMYEKSKKINKNLFDEFIEEHN
jgi:predicted kinase